MKLSEACSYSKGKKPPILNGIKTSNTSIPYINIKAFEKGIYDEYTNGDKCNLCNDGDILMVWDGARCGMVGKAKKGAVGSTLMKITPKPNVLNEYLYYFLESQFHILNTNPKGVGIPHIEPQLLWNLELRIPSKEEQAAIVAKLEKLFSELDSGKQQLLKAQEQLKVYRQSLLKAAFEGKLTNDNVKEGELPEGWKWVKLNEICDIKGGVTKGKDYKEKTTFSFPYLRVANVQDGYLDISSIKFIDVPMDDLEKYRLLYGDILYTEGGDKDKLGRGTIWKNEIVNCIHQNHIFRARPKSDNINSQYLAYFSRSQFAKNYFYKHGKQTTNLASINLSILSALPIVMPNKEIQDKIVTTLDSKLLYCNEIEEAIRHGLLQVEMLRQSILNRAFLGRLI